MIEGFPIIGLTAPTLLGLVVFLILKGLIVPRSTLVDKAAESDRWRLAYEKEREARATSDSQTTELLEVTKTTHNLLVAMLGGAERYRQSGAIDVVPKKE